MSVIVQFLLRFVNVLAMIRTYSILAIRKILFGEPVTRTTGRALQIHYHLNELKSDGSTSYEKY